MWILCDPVTDQHKIWLSPSRSYIVGRKQPGSDILIDNDKSISREHAKITVGTPADVELDQTKKKTKISKPDISIKDSSKYGVEVNNTKLGKSLKMLQHGDTIKFGVYQSVFKLKYEPFVFCGSRIANAKTQILSQCVVIDSKLESSVWTPYCTHLVVKDDTKDWCATEKIALALLECKPIVTVHYVDALHARMARRDELASQTPLPDPEKYLPNTATKLWKDSVDGKTTPTLAIKEERRNLFKDRVFVFIDSKLAQKNKTIIETGSGTVVDASDIELDEDFFEKYQSAAVIIDDANNPKVQKLKELRFQPINEKNILASILTYNTKFIEGEIATEAPQLSQKLSQKATQKSQPVEEPKKSQPVSVKTESQMMTDVAPSLVFDTTQHRSQHHMDPSLDSQSSQTTVRSRKDRPKSTRKRLELVEDKNDDSDDDRMDLLIGRKRKPVKQDEEMEEAPKPQEKKKPEPKKKTVSSEEEEEPPKPKEKKKPEPTKRKREPTPEKDDEEEEEAPKRQKEVKRRRVTSPVPEEEDKPTEKKKPEPTKRKVSEEVETKSETKKKARADSQTEEADDGISIDIAYESLIVVKDEEDKSSYANNYSSSGSTGFNAKKFRKAPVGERAVHVIEDNSQRSQRSQKSSYSQKEKVKLDEDAGIMMTFQVPNDAPDYVDIFDVDEDDEDEDDQLDLLADIKTKKRK